MKKRIISFITSVAMTATAVTSTLALTVSAASIIEKNSTTVVRLAHEKCSLSTVLLIETL